MELISIDLYELNGKQHLVTMDGYSGYVISQKLKNITTQDVINALEKTFQLFGYPERIRSDNGRQLVSAKMSGYLLSKGIRQETSSPHFPSSNGHAESGVKIVKHLEKKCLESGEDFQSALAELRRQPRTDGKTPSDLFLKREVKGEKLKIIPKKELNSENAKHSEAEETSKNSLRQLKVGEKVRVQNIETKEWKDKAVIVQVCENGRSYFIEMDDDRSGLRRNRRYLRPLMNPEQKEADAKSTEAEAAKGKVEICVRRSERIRAQNKTQDK